MQNLGSLLLKRPLTPNILKNYQWPVCPGLTLTFFDIFNAKQTTENRANLAGLRKQGCHLIFDLDASQDLFHRVLRQPCQFSSCASKSNKKNNTGVNPPLCICNFLTRGPQSYKNYRRGTLTQKWKVWETLH